MTEPTAEDLEAMVRDLAATVTELDDALKEIKALGLPVHQVVAEEGERFLAKLEMAMSLNAGLFEATPSPKAKVNFLKVDDAFRTWMTTIKELLALPRREG